MFVMDESNVLDSSFLERMNTLLANGEVGTHTYEYSVCTHMHTCKHTHTIGDSYFTEESLSC